MDGFIDKAKAYLDARRGERRSVGTKTREQMLARNIAPRDKTPDWRVAEMELVRWMRFRGFRFYDRSTVRS